MKSEIEQLKVNIFSNNWELVKSSATRLGEIGGEDVVDFLISLLSLADSDIRNRAALELENLKADKAVEPLLEAIFKNENRNYNGTMVFALESLDCSKYFKEIFKILFFEGYEAKLSANAILSEQSFIINQKDINEIIAIWNECIENPNLCTDFSNSKDMIEKQVTKFMNMASC